MGEMIKSSEQLPPIGEWVLGTTDNRRKPWEIIKYCGVVKYTTKSSITNWEEYEYEEQEFTNGFGTSTRTPPEYWMPLPENPKFPKIETTYNW